MLFVFIPDEGRGKGKGGLRKKTTEKEVEEILQGNFATFKEEVRRLSYEVLQARPLSRHKRIWVFKKDIVRCAVMD